MKNQHTQNKHKAEAKSVGLTLLGPGRTSRYRTYLFNECEHKGEFSLQLVRRGSVRCGICQKQKLRVEATAAGLTVVGPGKNKDYRTYRFNKCQHELEIHTGSVRKGHFRCKKCFHEKLKSEADAADLALLGPGKTVHYRTYRFNECRHEQEIETAGVRKGVFRCRQCINEKLEAESIAAGLTLISPGKNALYRTYRFNECKHEREFTVDQVRKGEVRCGICQKRKLRVEATAAGLTVVGPGKTRHHRTYLFDECGHEQEVETGQVRAGEVRCGICQEQKLRVEAAAAGLAVVGPGKDARYRTYRFNQCRHKQEIQVGAVRSGHFICNMCEETARDLPSNVYLVKIKTSSFEWLKFGYAGNVDERVKQYGLPADAEVTTVIVRPFDTGREAHEFEKSIHGIYANRGLPPEQMRKFHTITGFEECYPIDLMGKLSEEIKML